MSCGCSNKLPEHYIDTYNLKGLKTFPPVQNYNFVKNNKIESFTMSNSYCYVSFICIVILCIIILIYLYVRR